ncbi:MAG TPA: 3-hydroxyacyl-CoA dehydrogenase family protein, partial [Gammaproteobacteria bacterium]|nr:3-hydroxyacyl-CoA dehydrogenase family protein [Gammaproteobacteria bacterium]
MNQKQAIDYVAVLGAGTMGSGIAALCAEAGCQVLLLDISREASAQALQRLCSGKNPVLESAASTDRIHTGSFAEDLHLLADCDWICEVIVEDLVLKQKLLQKVAEVRKDTAVISTNTSGIPLRDICARLPLSMRQHMAVTHFFNPVKFMRLLELVPSADAEPEVITELAQFCRNRLGKGIVHAKDTVNFIGNRVGCFWILSGLAAGKQARAEGLDLETIDALLGAPVGLPKTGLYGLVDLIGLDVMQLVGLNLKANLPSNDPGLTYADLPAEEQAMLDRGQLGRKSGGGYYRLLRHADGSKSMEVYNPDQDSWR